jgi:NADH:ubiquinone oxidoreductase subunit 3 (subunit A)
VGFRRVYAPALWHRRGDFLFSSFIAGAVLHPLLDVLTSFLFSWAVFGKARNAAVAAAVAASSLLAVLLPGLIWTSVSSLSSP